MENQLKIKFSSNYGNQISNRMFTAFLTCNNADGWEDRKLFYVLKNEILDKYGIENGYDIQVLNKHCYGCDGTGVWNYYYHGDNDETCLKCNGTGVYSSKHIVLKRYILNKVLFHKPLGELDGKCHVRVQKGDSYETVQLYGIIKDRIVGIVKHEPTGYNPKLCLYLLLLRYHTKGVMAMAGHDAGRAIARAVIGVMKRYNHFRYNVLRVLKNKIVAKVTGRKEAEDLPF